ncbi:MAG: GNAT family N-acetyltransferase [Eubacteriales bacterium]|nr:GNAT family N-acetyltransferase [Eubacteriales bacterium]
MVVRELTKSEYGVALELALSVFQKFEARDYSEEGIATFNRLIHDSKYQNEIRVYGAFDGEALVGQIATRSNGNHISLFFVDDRYQRQGIGKRLFALACADNPSGKISVHFSPYAVEIYSRLGFHATDNEQVSSGIRFTPMECILKDPDCPCTRSRCQRHGDCAACREHHKSKKNTVACERLVKMKSR